MLLSHYNIFHYYWCESDYWRWRRSLRWWWGLCDWSCGETCCGCGTWRKGTTYHWWLWLTGVHWCKEGY